MIARIKNKLSITIYRYKLKKSGVMLDRGTILSRKTVIEGPSKFYKNVNIRNSRIGHHTYLSSDCYFPNTIIGRFTSIGNNCRVAFGNHPQRPFVSFSPSFYSTLKQNGDTFVNEEYFENYLTTIKDKNIICEIGNDCWIGSNVTIINGCKIGDGALVAAGAVVTKDVEPYTVVGGVPAKFIKYRFSENEINFLLSKQWWNFEIDFIKKNALLFHDIEKFMEMFDKL